MQQRFSRFFNIILIIVLVDFGGNCFGQSKDEKQVSLPRTQEFVLYSKIVKQGYKLYVSTPPGFTEAKSYSVVYLLDADYSFAIVKNITDHLTERSDMEGLILVGIAYDGPDEYQRHRTRDYTPVYSTEGGYSPEIQSHSGGGPNFIKFLEKELFPFIDSSFNITDTRCLVGHSFGGLLTSYILFSVPDLFSRYIIVSPSVWYSNRYLLQVENDWSDNHAEVNARVYLGVGSLESARMLADADSLVSMVRKHNYRGLTFRNEILSSETHNSVFPSAVSNGLRFVFQGR